MGVIIQLYLILLYHNLVFCDKFKSLNTKENSFSLKTSNKSNSTTVTANITDISSSTISYYEENSPITTGDGEITYEIYENVTEIGLDTENTTTIPETTIDYENVTISLLNNGEVATTSATPKINKKRGLGLQRVHENSSCACDVTFASCDVLCCCDMDCPSDANQMFPYCVNKQEEKPNLRYCDSGKNNHNNEQSEFLASEINVLFCVMKDNSPEKTITLSVDMTSLHDVKKLSEEYHSWKNNYFVVTNTTYEVKPAYGYGDTIWMINNNSILAVGMPSAFLTEFCSERSPLTFLKNKKSSCLTRLTDLEMFNANTNIQDMCVMTTPALFNRSCIEDNMNTSACGCITIENFLCNNIECNKVEKSDTLPLPMCNETDCVNMATSVKFMFHTNSTNIIKGLLYVYLSNVSSSFKYVRQEFESVYFYRTNNVTLPRELSGNPGYIVGKPVIVSNVIQNNTEAQFDYYLTNDGFPLRNVLTYPKNIAGNCALSNVTFVPISFGENVKSFCKYKQNVDLNDNYNASIFCVDFQKNVLNFLQLSGIENKVVSKYGNPYTGIHDIWIPFLYDDQIYEIQGWSNENTVFCRNFVRSISYEFSFGRIDNGTGKREATILSVFLKRNPEDVIEFKISNNVVSTIISVSTMFYDVTKVTNYGYVAEHKFYLHIPYDFFYPFTMNAGNSMHHTVCVFFSLILINFLFL